jgi:hypothetical protein
MENGRIGTGPKIKKKNVGYSKIQVGNRAHVLRRLL